MGWSNKHKKMRDELRKKYTEETGSADYASPEFKAWVDRLLANE